MAEPAEHLGFSAGRVQPLARTPMSPLLTLRSRARKQSLSASADSQQQSSAPGSDTVDRGTMIVGREIAVSVDIDFSDRLIVDGTVEASLHECRQLHIAASARFRGNASAGNADISGRFIGDLVVQHRLIIPAGGHVSGTITTTRSKSKTAASFRHPDAANQASGKPLSQAVYDKTAETDLCLGL
jgi:cytoskeletal protein CcmA (bactofilin family)